ncbi:glycosyltransferase [Nocardioides sp. YIM 152315]|uniref:glycosyltransferase n=1 Tax=Nocardioides sp. YIM 152315 TaxID=3031760 RepID=UPI0023DAF427|nr:glycosyltransferase [Nocardioides sp. YIM 152315]MDF1606320.1 glycosyltransferase [Nocardioides sp. YIM 152315]
MTRFLVYLSPAVGHTLPLVPGLLELQRRGHDVHVRAMPSLVPVLTEAGVDATAVIPEVLSGPAFEQGDLIARGDHDGPDLLAALAEVRPDVLLVDVNAYGAQVRAEASGLPWATLMPSVVPVPGRGVPPYGVGMKPMGGPLGRARDAVVWKLVERVFAKAMLPGLNDLRRDAGLREYASPLDSWRPPRRAIAMTAEPLEYPRTDLPANIHLVGTQPWDPPAERPPYLDEPGDPWVLVTCSTDYQGDERLARVAAEALRDEPVRVLITLADAYDDAALTTSGNVRVERFVPHGHVLPRAAAVVCHGGMGIVTKAACAGVPAVVVPFGRDQPEIARRVTEAGAGVTLRPKRLTPERLRGAVRRAMTMSAEAKAVARRLDPTGAPGRFADAALSLVPSEEDDHVSP